MNSYKPACENSIDEAMIPFKGRSSMKQYMPKKPIKRGFKIWVRADASQLVLRVSSKCTLDVSQTLSQKSALVDML